MKNLKPIIVAGIHRSGTTWFANMLNIADDTLILNEPFNIDQWSYSLNSLAKYWYTYAPSLNQEKALSAYATILNKGHRKLFPKRTIQHWLPFLRAGRPIVKDPLSSASLEWIREHFDVESIVMLRHPCAFVSSLKRKEWFFPFQHLIKQEKLIEKYLPDLKNDLNNIDETNIIENGALCWKAINTILYKTYSDDKDILVVKHEDVSLNPIKSFARIYKKMGLEWSLKVKAELISYTSSGNPVNAPRNKTHHLKRNSKSLVDNWKNDLSDHEISKILEIGGNVVYKIGYKK